MGQEPFSSLVRMPVAGFLAWLVPGLGHIYLKHHARGIVFLVTITVTFWTGVAIGGVPQTVNPHERQLWFAAQLCTAGNAVAAYAITPLVTSDPPAPSRGPAQLERVPPPAHWMSADIGVHYTGVAGLLNLLVIFDALARAEPRRPTGRAELKPGGGGT